MEKKLFRDDQAKKSKSKKGSPAKVLKLRIITEQKCTEVVAVAFPEDEILQLNAYVAKFFCVE